MTDLVRDGEALALLASPTRVDRNDRLLFRLSNESPIHVAVELIDPEINLAELGREPNNVDWWFRATRPREQLIGELFRQRVPRPRHLSASPALHLEDEGSMRVGQPVEIFGCRQFYIEHLRQDVDWAYLKPVGDLHQLLDGD
jgi:hypothetical protein